MDFWLGTHQVNWLETMRVPLFVSHRRLRRRSRLPRAQTTWALDSGAFSELHQHGRWTESPRAYLGAVHRYRDEVGLMVWAAPQDWMCEPFMLQRTGLSVREHQERTTVNWLELRALDPTLPIIPVLQGWHVDDYRRHVDLYLQAGIDLGRAPLVGLGSVCRRQRMTEGVDLIWHLHRAGLQLHGFGIKLTGLAEAAHWLTSADSMAWSYDARRSPPLPGCTHRCCNNCPRWALRWHDAVLKTITEPKQERLAW